LAFDSQAGPSQSSQVKRNERLHQAVAKSVAVWRTARRRMQSQARPLASNNGRPNGRQWGAVPPPDWTRRAFGRHAMKNGGFRGPVPPPAIDVPAPGQPGRVASLPRSRFLKLRAGESTPPRMRRVEFAAKPAQALGRLVIWLVTLLRYVGGNWLDQARRRSTPQSRAIRLRRAFERMGGTGVKIGQYLAMRLDFLPWAYCVELSQMLDEMPPFPVEHAIAAIERRTGQPLAATFARFDPEPVGSDSVAGVYQGILRDGQRVVVRVRRPGVGELFMADLQVLDWILLAVEFLTILRPGFSAQMRREFRSAVLGTLDFVQEARYQDSFRRAAKRSGKRFFTAPRVFFEYSGDDVIVEEFVSGLWIWELLAGIEQQDEHVLARAADLGIDPATVARRLMWINYWGWDANFFFHADPHPDNIIVGRNGKLTLLDFSSIGSIDPDMRTAMHQNMYYMSKDDPLGMARASVTLLEPLPPIDVLEFTKELEAYNWQMLYVRATRKTNRAWTDRPLAIQWIGLFRVASQYGITMDFQALRLLRAMLLYDSLAARLHPGIDNVREYRRFARYRARRARVRIMNRFRRQVDKGFDQKVYIRLERLANMTQGMFARVRHLLAIPAANYNRLMGKGSVAIFALVRFAAQAVLVTVGFAGLIALGQSLLTGHIPANMAIVEGLLASPVYQVLLLGLFILNTRAVLFHLDDVDVG
jgi:ubiquinone biosynthesis protein